jgi:hypothetical protein
MRKGLVVILLLALAACSTEGKVTPILSSGTALPAGSVWSVRVTGCQSTECMDIRSSVVARLMGAGLLTTVTASGQPAPLDLTIEVTNMRTVSTTERILFGAMAGRNEVDATVTLKDDRGATLRAFQVHSGSAAHPFSGESGQQDAYRQFGNDVVAGLRS